MADEVEWSRDAYEASVSSRCWWFTPYDDGWDGSREHGADLPADDELRRILAMEQALGETSEWSQQLVGGCIRWLPPCGHYLFPLAYLEAVSAIGSETPPSFIHGCFTADRKRKERMLDYVFCLDAWLAGAGADDAARELAARERGGAAWQSVCTDLWESLGEVSETKQMLVQRVLDRQRWWLKSLVWDDDRRSLFGRGHYLGDLRGSGDSYGNPEFCDPYFVEMSVPRVRRLEAALAEVCPDWQEFKVMIDSSWLCAPKAFRYLERLLWSIGKGQPAAGEVPGFLQVDDTYPDHDSASRWWRGFLSSLDAWWQDQPAEGPIATDVGRRLGDPSPAKRWLVRLLVRRLQLLARHAEIARLVNPRPDRKRGRRRSPDA